MIDKNFIPPLQLDVLADSGIPDSQIELARTTSDELRGIVSTQKDKPSGPSVHELFSGYAEQHRIALEILA